MEKPEESTTAVSESKEEAPKTPAVNNMGGTGKPLSNALKVFYGIGDLGFSMMANIDTYYASYFFINIAQFSLFAVSVITTISAVADAILTPLYGPFMNKVKPQKWGRYRSWLIMTSWLIPFLYAAQFVSLGDGFAALAFCTVAMITSRIAWNLPFVANVAMINVAGTLQADRMALSSSRAMWGSAASILYSYGGPGVVALAASLIGEANSYAACAFAFSWLMVAGYFAHFKMFTGYEITGAEEIARMAKITAESGEAPPKVKALKVLTSNASLIFLFLSNCMKMIGNFLVSGIAVYYFTYVTHDPGMMAMYLLVANILGVIAGYIARFIVKAINPKLTVVITFATMVIFCMIGYLFYTNLIVVLVMMSLVNFMIRVSGACDPELYAKCARFIGQKMGYDVTGTVMGLITVPIKVGIVFRGILISAVLALAGFTVAIDPTTADVALQSGIAMGFMVLPAAAFAFGGLFILLGYREKDLIVALDE